MVALSRSPSEPFASLFTDLLARAARRSSLRVSARESNAGRRFTRLRCSIRRCAPVQALRSRKIGEASNLYRAHAREGRTRRLGKAEPRPARGVTPIGSASLHSPGAVASHNGFLGRHGYDVDPERLVNHLRGGGAQARARSRRRRDRILAPRATRSGGGSGLLRSRAGCCRFGSRIEGTPGPTRVRVRAATISSSRHVVEIGQAVSSSIRSTVAGSTEARADCAKAWAAHLLRFPPGGKGGLA